MHHKHLVTKEMYDYKWIITSIYWIWSEKSTRLESRLGRMIRFFEYREENNDNLLKREDTEANEDRKVLVDLIKQELIENRDERENSVARKQEAEDNGTEGRQNILINEEQCRQKAEAAENHKLDREDFEASKVKAEVKDVACIIKEEEVEDIKDMAEVNIQGPDNNDNENEEPAEET